MLIEILDHLFPLAIAFAFGLLASEIASLGRRVSRSERDNDEY